MTRIGAVFDLDGTLLDTLEDLAASMNAVLAGFDMPEHPAESYRYFVGDGIFNLAKRAALPGTDAETVRRMAALMNEKYAAGWSRRTRPYPGIPEMLTAFRERGAKLAVLSNKPDVFTRQMVRHYFPEGTFSAVFGARDTVPRKPDPAGALEIAGLLGAEPHRLLYFGDTNTDMQTGLAAGMVTIGVAWGFRPVRELTEAGAHAVIGSPDQAAAFLEHGSGRAAPHSGSPA